MLGVIECKKSISFWILLFVIIMNIIILRLKNAMLDAMKLTNTPKIQTSIGKWVLQTNPMSADVLDWTKVPMEFREPQPDKVDKPSLIKRHKETGELFEGVEFKQEQGIRFR